VDARLRGQCIPHHNDKVDEPPDEQATKGATLENTKASLPHAAAINATQTWANADFQEHKKNLVHGGNLILRLAHLKLYLIDEEFLKCSGRVCLWDISLQGPGMEIGFGGGHNDTRVDSLVDSPTLMVFSISDCTSRTVGSSFNQTAIIAGLEYLLYLYEARLLVDLLLPKHARAWATSAMICEGYWAKQNHNGKDFHV